MEACGTRARGKTSVSLLALKEDEKMHLAQHAESGHEMIPVFQPVGTGIS